MHASDIIGQLQVVSTGATVCRICGYDLGIVGNPSLSEVGRGKADLQEFLQNGSAGREQLVVDQHKYFKSVMERTLLYNE